MKVFRIFSSTDSRTPRGAGFGVVLVALLLCGCAGPATIHREHTLDQVKGANFTRTLFRQPGRRSGRAISGGGRSPETGFDCSGLVWWAYGQNGVVLPRTTRGQIKSGSPVGLAALTPGDLVFFLIGSGLHAGIVTGRDTFVHSPKSGGSVREESLWSQYWSQRFLEARRVI